MVADDIMRYRGSVLPVKVLRTDSNRFFVYDGLTSQIISINAEQSMDGINEEHLTEKVIPQLLEQGILTKGERGHACWPVSYEEYLSTLSSGIPSLVLQTTRNCNLACCYCIYSGKYSHMRPSAPEDMSNETMCRSIEFYAAHSWRTPKAEIAFYGGEPLLCFQSICNAVSYARKIFQRKPLEISISTNATLLNRKICDWLSENTDVNLIMTVNGAFQEHSRKDFSGKGSLGKVMGGIRLLQQDYPEVWNHQVSFIANYASSIEIPAIHSFYREQIGKNPMLLTKIRQDMGNAFIHKFLMTDEKREREVRKALRQEYFAHEDSFLDALFKPGIDLLDERKLFANEEEKHIASCMPFCARLFVRTDGKFNVCERTSDAFILGDLEHGFHETAIIRAMEEVRHLVDRNCSDCWAQRICLLCFQHMVDENGNIRQRIPEELCCQMRQNLSECLSMYCEIYG